MTVAIHEVADTRRPAATFEPLEIREDHCKGCELCITACPHHVPGPRRARS